MQSKLRKHGGVGVSLPEDVLFEVLLRLPTKSLRRFRCVCKFWLSLMSDRAFIAARRSRASPFMVTVFGSTPSEQELRLLGTDGDVLRVLDLRGSMALLAAQTRLDLVFVDRLHLGATVIHPASGRSFTVDPPWPSGGFRLIDYSFGRASPSGDYKVLRLHDTTNSSVWYNSRTQWCEVATIMEGVAEPPTWRQRPWGPFEQSSFSWEHKATVDGDLYFMLSYDYSISCGGNRIAVFNLESEEWKAEMIKGPLFRRQNHDDKWRVTLTELKGALCMVQNVLTGLGGHYVNIWLLKDPNRSVWVKEYKIQMPDRSLSLCTKPLDVLPDGKLLLLIEFWKAGNNKYILELYNSSTEVFTDFMEIAEGFDGKIAFYTGSHPS